MIDTIGLRTHDMPEEMRVLLNDYPREGWETHPGFKEKTRHWLEAHQMFRRLGELMRSETELYLDKARALVQLDKRQARDEAGRVLDSAQTIEAFLARHLGDEEDLAVPIILHHRLRG